MRARDRSFSSLGKEGGGRRRGKDGASACFQIHAAREKREGGENKGAGERKRGRKSEAGRKALRRYSAPPEKRKRRHEKGDGEKAWNTSEGCVEIGRNFYLRDRKEKERKRRNKEGKRRRKGKNTGFFHGRNNALLIAIIAKFSVP